MGEEARNKADQMSTYVRKAVGVAYPQLPPASSCVTLLYILAVNIGDRVG